MATRQTERFSEIFGNLWLIVYFYFALTYSSDEPPFRSIYVALSISGALYVYWRARSRVARVFEEYRGLWTSFFLFALIIMVVEVINFPNYNWRDPYLTYQAWIILCMPTLFYLFLNDQRLNLLLVALGMICVWHFFMVPVEAVTGWKMSWQDTTLIPRTFGILSYQASGLAKARYYYSGFFFPIFYIVVGTQQKRLPPWAFFALPILWLIPSLCTQSRSTFAGAVAAGAIMGLSHRNFRKFFLTFGVPSIILGGGFVYFFVLTSDKTGFSTHWAYFKHYLNSAIQWPYILFGHGQHFDRTPMFLPIGLHLHSHNDLIEIFWKWGGVALLAYVASWFFFIRLMIRRFLRRDEFWPLAAVVALIPNMMTDLGFMHFEKAIFITFLFSLCMALDTRRRLKFIEKDGV